MSLIKNTSIYLLANILNAAIPFFLLPILTRYLTLEQYGQIAMFQVVLSGLTLFVGINSAGAANRKYYDDITPNIIKEFNGSCIQILIGSTFIPLLLIFLFSEKLTYFFAIPSSWLYISVIISTLTFLSTIRLGQWQIRGNAKQFGLLQINSSFINMLLSIIFIVFFSYGSEGRVNAQLITAIIIGIVSIFLLYKDKLLTLFIWRPKQLKEALLFGIPLIPHNLGFFLITSIDRFIINKELGLATAGIYMVAAQISTSLAILVDAVNKAYMPWLFSKLKENQYNEKLKIVKYTYIYFAIALVIVLCAFIIGPSFIIFIAGEKYAEAGKLIGWLCLGQAFGGMYLMVANYIFYSRKNNKLAIITFFCGIINIIILFILIPRIGLLGAGIAYAFSRFMQFILTWRLASIHIKMPWFYFAYK
ncbi:lipopolysaccharide biosynthesis protein [Providencia sp.]|uniref:lipopolysaccharide biosynthesis protein n=1 Tax=Providencia sp. TaxID=589 RepID=UPI003F977DE0